MSKKKVLVFARHDWANSGYKMTEAINRHSERYEAKYFSGQEHPFGYKRSGVINIVVDGQNFPNNKVIHELKDWAKQCDIIHFKGDEGVYDHIAEVSIPINKVPVLWTVCGTHWRVGHADRWEQFGGMVSKLLATTPDLIFPEIGGELLPFAIDTERYKRQEFTEDCFLIGHSPSQPNKKGTGEIADAINRLIANNTHVYPNVTVGIPFPLAMAYKRLSHVFVDQITELGVYGNSAVEAGVFGCAVIASHAYGAGYEKASNADELYELLDQLLKNPNALKKAQDRSYRHTVETHSYPVICDKVERYYDEVLQ